MKKTHLVVHHSLTKDSGTVSWNAIRRWHVEERGYRDVGYHGGIELVGWHYEFFLGRPFDDIAAAAYQQSMNRVGIHVCFVGNYDLAPPPEKMLEFAVPHLRGILRIFEIPVANVIGHRDVAPYKSCPGTKFAMNKLRGMLE